MNKPAFITLLLLISSGIFAQEPIVGSWEGTLHIQNKALRIRFHIEASDSLYHSRMDSPDQGAFDLPTTRTSFRDNKLEIIASGLGLFYRGTLLQDTIEGTLNQGGMPLPLNLYRFVKTAPDRPQTPQEPFPYAAEELLIPAGDGDRVLGATLTLPAGKGPFPAVMLIAGSGPNDRDETVFGHKPFLVIADHLTRQGFAVLRYDKRGVGKSTGNFSTATIEDFANDARAVVNYLKQQEEIDPDRIGLLGHSEGGLVSAMLAAGNRDIAFAVLMAAPGTTGMEIVLDQNQISLTHQGVEPETIEELQKLNRETFGMLLEWKGTEEDRTALRDQLSRFWNKLPLLVRMKVEKEAFLRSQFNAMTMPGYLSFLRADPSLYLKEVTCPLLALNGEKDTQVPAMKNIRAITSALEIAGNKNVETRIYPGLNHLFQECITGLTDEYAKSEQTLAPVMLNEVGEWLKEVTTVSITFN
ncbi:MAG: alpha/beta fold hydrolase [Proteiniphilum sp.]